MKSTALIGVDLLLVSVAFLLARYLFFSVYDDHRELYILSIAAPLAAVLGYQMIRLSGVPRASALLDGTAMRKLFRGVVVCGIIGATRLLFATPAPEILVLTKQQLPGFAVHLPNWQHKYLGDNDSKNFKSGKLKVVQTDNPPRFIQIAWQSSSSEMGMHDFDLDFDENKWQKNSHTTATFNGHPGSIYALKKGQNSVIVGNWLCPKDQRRFEILIRLNYEHKDALSLMSRIAKTASCHEYTSPETGTMLAQYKVPPGSTIIKHEDGSGFLTKNDEAVVFMIDKETAICEVFGTFKRIKPRMTVEECHRKLHIRFVNELLNASKLGEFVQKTKTDGQGAYISRATGKAEGVNSVAYVMTSPCPVKGLMLIGLTTAAVPAKEKNLVDMLLSASCPR